MKSSGKAEGLVEMEGLVAGEVAFQLFIRDA